MSKSTPLFAVPPILPGMSGDGVWWRTCAS